MNELLELAARCEAAEGPDRGLDNDIRYAARQPFNAHQGPSYTASLDAAMTLVPEGWSINLNTPGAYHGIPQARLKHPDRNPCGDGEAMRGGASTPALALCAAALRALATQSDPLPINRGVE